MKTALTREDIVDLLNYLGSPHIKNIEGKDDIQFCCTVHGESNPSAGVSISKQQFNCFACHAHGSIAWLVYQTDKQQFTSVVQAYKFLSDRYGVTYNLDDKGSSANNTINLYDIKTYDEVYTDKEVPTHKEKPMYTIAPFKSGKSTYQYFFDRGFNTQTVKDFMIGRDLDNKTVTVPVFWANNKLAGVIGRFIDPNRPKNARYKIYEGLNTGDLLFPLNHFKPINNTIILCEGLLDSLWLHQNGYINALATLTNHITKKQVEIIKSYNCSTIICFGDNDDKGSFANKSYYDNLKKSHEVLVANNYPVENLKDPTSSTSPKDPQDLIKEQIDLMVNNAKSYLQNRLLNIKKYE